MSQALFVLGMEKGGEGEEEELKKPSSHWQ